MITALLLAAFTQAATVPQPAVSQPTSAPASAPASAEAGPRRVECRDHFVVELQGGVVTRRIPVPSRCLRVTPAGDTGYRVEYGDNDAKQPWSRGVERAFAEPEPALFPMATYMIDAVQARRVGRDALSAHLDDLEQAKAALDAEAARDHTNPWLAFYRGEALLLQGRSDLAQQAFAAALAYDRQYDFELLRMAADFDRLAQWELGDAAFTRGMQYLVRHGYSPELAIGALAPATYLGPAPDEPGSRAALRHAGRLLDFSPRAEGIADRFRALSQPDARNQEPVDHAAFARARDEAEATRLFGFQPAIVGALGPLLNLCLGGLLGLAWLWLWRALGGRALWPYRRWRSGELVGFIAATALALLAGLGCARAIAFIDATTEQTPTFLNGHMGHPESVRMLEDTRGSDNVGRLLALSYAMAGNDTEADKTLARFDDGFSLCNRGVLALRRGDHNAARELFGTAAALGDEAAQYNLRMMTDAAAASAPSTPTKGGSRIERAARYGAPWLWSLPHDAWFRELAVRRLDLAANPATGWQKLLSLTATHDLLASSTLARAPVHSPALFFFGLTLALLAIVELLRRARGGDEQPVRAPDTFSVLTAALAPGAALGSAGAFVALAAGAAALAIASLIVSGGAFVSVFDFVLQPALGSVYGELLAPSTGLSGLWRIGAPWLAGALVVANLVGAARSLVALRRGRDKRV